jgi:hypothetical protein
VTLRLVGGLIYVSTWEVFMGKMNYERANKIQRTGKAQSEFADADHPPGITSNKVNRTPAQEEARNKIISEREMKEQEIRNAKRIEFLEQTKVLFECQIEILGCKPDGSDAWIQLLKLKEANPDEKLKYCEAYHRLNEIVTKFS